MSRWLTLGLLTGAGAGVLGLTATMTAAFAFGDDLALISGGANAIGYETTTGPEASFVTGIYDAFIQPTYPEYSQTALDLPALDLGLVTGSQLDSAAQELGAAITADSGDNLVVSTFSESASAMTLLLNQWATDGGGPSPDNITAFILLGDLNNPDGGIYERFADLNPGIDYYAATPALTDYNVDVYTLQYDGVADFPQYPSDFYADLNAAFGYLDTHLSYNDLTPAQVGSAVLEPSSVTDTDGLTATDFYMIPTQNLPMLDYIRDIPGIGNAIADLYQPEMRVLVDMGYDYGYTSADGTDTYDASAPTEASFGTPDYNYLAIYNDLSLGMQQGFLAFEHDIGVQVPLPDAYPFLPYVPGDTTVANPDLIEPNQADSLASLQALVAELLPGLPSGLSPDLGGLTGDLGGLQADISAALASLGYDFTGILGAF